ncbi:MAG TPA: hypothetical protein VFS33_08320 [Gemmatimonadales bacterium]|nr:hypothetical protein [Gemmatimonadales bacterium]
MTRSKIVLLALLAATLGVGACSAADSTTGPRPAFKCENQGSNTVRDC